MTTTINVKGDGSTDGMSYGGGSFCHQCGWTIKDLADDAGGDTTCDACGADLSLNTGLTPAAPPAPAAAPAGGHPAPAAGGHPAPPPVVGADESPCDRRPAASATKGVVYVYLVDEWGYTDDEIGGFTKAELKQLVVDNCG